MSYSSVFIDNYELAKIIKGLKVERFSFKTGDDHMILICWF